jgi:hypothetical protein
VSGTERPGDGARQRRSGDGRPLAPSRDAAILEAALEGLAERGYDLLTMDEIVFSGAPRNAPVSRLVESIPE